MKHWLNSTRWRQQLTAYYTKYETERVRYFNSNISVMKHRQHETLTPCRDASRLTSKPATPRAAGSSPFQPPKNTHRVPGEKASAGRRRQHASQHERRSSCGGGRVVAYQAPERWHRGHGPSRAATLGRHTGASTAHLLRPSDATALPRSRPILVQSERARSRRSQQHTGRRDAATPVATLAGHHTAAAGQRRRDAPNTRQRCRRFGPTFCCCCLVAPPSTCHGNHRSHEQGGRGPLSTRAIQTTVHFIRRGEFCLVAWSPPRSVFTSPGDGGEAGARCSG